MADAFLLGLASITTWQNVLAMTAGLLGGVIAGYMVEKIWLRCLDRSQIKRANLLTHITPENPVSYTLG